MGFFSNLFSGSSGRRQAIKGARDVQQALGEQETILRKEVLPAFQGALQPFIDQTVDTQALRDISSPGAFRSRLDSIRGLIDPVIQERLRAVQGQVAASGLRRSGGGLRAIADVPAEVLLGLESELFDREFGGETAGTRLDLADLGRRGNLANIFASGTSKILGRIGRGRVESGEALRTGRLQGAQARAAAQGNILSFLGDIGGGLFPAAAQAGSFGALFSDERLKTNVERLGDVDGLPLYSWDWIEDAPELVKACPRVGFMAREVLEQHPEAVDEFCGYLVVNYGELLWQTESQALH